MAFYKIQAFGEEQGRIRNENLERRLLLKFGADTRQKFSPTWRSERWRKQIRLGVAARVYGFRKERRKGSIYTCPIPDPVAQPGGPI
ncbi:hypothetical protein COLO4_15246 [Corchorus olitorius]|uniref:Uncharacterized protein n=1 Tax=Corchorus olitorius TaxID=93759 RepID=A0A1R3JNW8_9ROSI|nr:hypothetical protein COLO4_15246 [Corchorus olitorius]